MTLGALPGETIVYVCDGVFTGQRPMTLFLFTDDEPQALCAETHGSDTSSCKPPHLVCLDHVYQMFPDIPWLSRLEKGEAAFRLGDIWSIEPWEQEQATVDSLQAGTALLGAQPLHRPVFTCVKVYNQTAPLSCVYMDEEGNLGALCDDPEHDHDAKDSGVLIGLHHVLNLSPDLADVGITASHGVQRDGLAWTPFALEDDA